MKSYVITITEVDDIDIALENLNEQMANIELLKNSVGIVSVSPDFIDSEVYAAVANALPFPVAGMTTFSQTANGETGMFLLSILVLTSDTCEFSCGYSAKITDDADITGLMRDCYAEVKSGLSGEPKLALLYAPFPSNDLTGPACEALNALSAENSDMPVFGSLACREVENVMESCAIFGAGASTEHFALVLMSGDISPDFYVGAVADDATLISVVGVVTKASGNRVYEINGVNTKQFLEQMNYFMGKDVTEAATSAILIAETKDENGKILSSLAQGILLLTDEYAVLDNFIEVGTVLSLAALTKEAVIETTTKATEWVKAHEQNKAALIYSCLGRWFAAADESLKEFDIIDKALAGISYQASYSGGEICPTSVKGEKMLNAKHTSSVTVCIF
ncbi:MAG: FIST C-terminal domain-containing protein [Defluviitaleaceae bacterium]|nr:FIST C-terminal domain-containing protein [Defluviitaleaceae bacterium]